jgi:hypothetical protein
MTYANFGADEKAATKLGPNFGGGRRPPGMRAGARGPGGRFAVEKHAGEAPRAPGNCLREGGDGLAQV